VPCLARRMGLRTLLDEALSTYAVVRCDDCELLDEPIRFAIRSSLKPFVLCVGRLLMLWRCSLQWASSGSNVNDATMC